MPNHVEQQLAEDFMSQVLRPYKVDYVRKATIQHPAEGPSPLEKVVIKGELSIDEPVYIQDTGHFNAVEFTMCYNMLVYMLIGHCVSNGLIDELRHVDYDEFMKRQLSDVLIVELGQRFRSPITSALFFGEVAITEVFRKNTNVFMRTRAKFSNGATGYADGEILLVFINN